MGHNVLEWQFGMTIPLSIAAFLLGAVSLSGVASAQQAAPGPLGVLIKPREQVEVPDTLRRVLPTGAVARLLQLTHLTAQGEEILVYDTGHEFEPSPHVVVIKSGKLVADFGLPKLFEDEDAGDAFTLFSAAQIATREKANAFVAAFRNIGDGAGTLFVVVAYRGGNYNVAWKHAGTQSQLRVRRDGRLQLWESSGDGGCTWCPHHYDITIFGWKNGKPSKLNHVTTTQEVNPATISATPIVIEK